MSRKILKVLTVLLLLALLTMPNFIYVGVGLASYAESSTATSHQNIEFDAELKEGDILSLSVNVKREGYFNGEITAVPLFFAIPFSDILVVRIFSVTLIVVFDLTNVF